MKTFVTGQEKGLMDTPFNFKGYRFEDTTWFYMYLIELETYMTLIRLSLPIVDQWTCLTLSIRPVHFQV